MDSRKNNEIVIPKTITERMESWRVGDAEQIINEKPSSWQNKRHYFHKKYPDRRIKIWTEGRKTFAGRTL